MKTLPEEIRPRYPAVQKEVLEVFKFTDQEFAQPLIKMHQTADELKNKIPFLQNPDFWKRRVIPPLTTPHFCINFFHSFFPPPIAANYKEWFKHRRALQEAVKDLGVFEQAEREALERGPFMLFTEDYIKMKVETIAKKDKAAQNLEQILKETTEETRFHLLLRLPNLPEDYDANPPGG